MIKKSQSRFLLLAVAAGLYIVIPGAAWGEPISTAIRTIFGPNVYVFDTTMPAADIQATAGRIFSKMEASQLGSERFALLFKPGAYRAIEVPSVEGVKLHHLTTIWLNGKTGSEITHVLNNIGGRVYANSPADAMRQTYRDFGGKHRGDK